MHLFDEGVAIDNLLFVDIAFESFVQMFEIRV
jgi:hypothetical protein